MEITAKITRKGGYKCAPEGHTVLHFEEGEVVTGKAAEYAIADRAGRRMIKKGARNTKATQVEEVK